MVDSSRSILLSVGGGVTAMVFVSSYWKRILDCRMIVDIGYLCILNGAILLLQFQGQRGMPADFLFAVIARCGLCNLSPDFASDDSLSTNEGNLCIPQIFPITGRVTRIIKFLEDGLMYFS